MSHQLRTALTNFKQCADNAPKGTYEEAKRLNEVIGTAVDQLIQDIRVLGLKADNCDHAFELEAAIYEYVKQSNPDGALFPVAEGFGVAMEGPARNHVIAQAIRDRGVIQNSIGK